MKKCPKCQAASPEDSKFCPACGTEAVEVSKESKAVVRAGQSRYCPNCGAECTTDTAFCPKCGTSLNAPTAALNAEPESCQENRPPEVNEWYFKNRPMLPPVRHTRIMSQGTMLSVERWKQFGFSYGKTNFRIDVKNITAIVLKQKVSVFSIMELIVGVLALLAGVYMGDIYTIFIGAFLSFIGFKGLKDKYIYVQFPNGYFEIQDSFAVGSDVDRFLQYVSYYNPDCVRTFLG